MQLGPIRSWPGGVCVSRSIGDVDCGPLITPLPHVKQVRVRPHLTIVRLLPQVNRVRVRPHIIGGLWIPGASGSHRKASKGRRNWTVAKRKHMALTGQRAQSTEGVTGRALGGERGQREDHRGGMSTS